ncbi:hypothetical protein CCACVL1_21290 [Corchorus capsularis]|uniref:Uncharacterized protein n=1 Tax=Corchorus capsularis TaxID=210143 RepID=A0A1R3H723_COCAP|nr:hypothetical protein CCACVL1_21290 [Corchorus capsularis]
MALVTFCCNLPANLGPNDELILPMTGLYVPVNEPWSWKKAVEH